MKYIASGEDFFTNDKSHCILLDADDFKEALAIYRACFPDDLCINIDVAIAKHRYPDPTHHHIKHGAHHHAVPITVISIANDDLDVERSSLNGFNIMFKAPPASLGISGCPMGRGVTVDAAKADLKRRTESESQVTINFTE